MTSEDVRRWRVVHPDFERAIRIGQARGVAFLEDLYRDVALGGAGDAAALRWLLVNRSGSCVGWHKDALSAEYAETREAKKLEEIRLVEQYTPEERAAFKKDHERWEREAYARNLANAAPTRKTNGPDRRVDLSDLFAGNRKGQEKQKGPKGQNGQNGQRASR